ELRDVVEVEARPRGHEASANSSLSRSAKRTTPRALADPYSRAHMSNHPVNSATVALGASGSPHCGCTSALAQSTQMPARGPSAVGPCSAAALTSSASVPPALPEPRAPLDAPLVAAPAAPIREYIARRHRLVGEEPGGRRDAALEVQQLARTLELLDEQLDD